MKTLISFFSWWGLRLDSTTIPPKFRHKPERITARTAWALARSENA